MHHTPCHRHRSSSVLRSLFINRRCSCLPRAYPRLPWFSSAVDGRRRAGHAAGWCAAQTPRLSRCSTTSKSGRRATSRSGSSCWRRTTFRWVVIRAFGLICGLTTADTTHGVSQHDRGWWGGRESVGREKMLSGIASFRKAYPDLKCATLADERPNPYVHRTSVRRNPHTRRWWSC
jgi:hypothetical protein